MEKLTFTIKDNGDQVYRNKANQLHNPVGPAVIESDSYKAYWLNGKRHNEDGPAIIYPDGSEEYWLNGELHNEDGPAVVLPDGTKVYYLNGKLHNENGPAVIYPDGTEEYWLNHKPLSKKEWEQQVKKVKEVTMTELHELLGYEVKIKED